MQTIWAETALLPQGWAERVLVEIDTHGRIGCVSQGVEPHGVRCGALLPSPVNAHSHGFQRAMAGLTEGRSPHPTDSFWTWREVMFRFLTALTPDDVEAITAMAQLEMLEAGYSTCVEFHYLHHRPNGEPYENIAEMTARIAAAAAITGIGLTLLPVQYQFGGCDERPLGPGQTRFGNTPDRFAMLADQAFHELQSLPKDTHFGLALHSLRAVGPDSIRNASSLARGGPLHMHLAEQQAEVDDVLAHHGARPAQWLVDNVNLDSRWCLIHCTHMQPDEVVALAQTGAVAALCPITEANLGDGIFDGTRWLASGGKTAIGSDSNIRISLSEELRTLEYSQRLRDQSRSVLATREKSSGRSIFDSICAGGALAAGRENGQIATGLLGDLLALDTSHSDLAGLRGDSLLDSWVFALDDRRVSDVWSAGRHMVRSGRHIDRGQILAAYASVAKRLRSRL